MIIVNITIQAVGLGMINDQVVEVLSGALNRRHFSAMFVAVISVATLSATIPYLVP